MATAFPEDQDEYLQSNGVNHRDPADDLVHGTVSKQPSHNQAFFSFLVIMYAVNCGA